MDVIGQDTYRDGFEWAALLYRSVGPPKAFDLLDQEVTRPFRENDREKEDTAFDFGSTVLRHNE
jgi:hypothetical protein